MDMMTRRRAMMAGIALPEWDYEWTYEDGLPEDNDWLKFISGTADSSIQTGYCRMRTSGGTNYYVTYRNPDLFNMSKGVMEVVAALTIPSSNPGGYTRICLGNGTNGIQINYWASDKTIKLYDGAAAGSGTIIKSNIVSNTYYTIKLVLDGEYGDVYIDGVKVASDIDIQTIQYSKNTSIWHQGSSNYNTYTRLKSVKLKIGRTA